MRTLEFDVERQVLKKTPRCDFSNIIAGSVGYLRAKFYFLSEDWDNCRKVASFWSGENEYPVLIDENNECVIPAEALTGRTFHVSVTGASSSAYKIKTTKFKVKQGV